MPSNGPKPLLAAVTADDVAEKAGVSRWTVNRAFKKDASISERSRKKVLEAAEALGYVPDLLAASMRSDKSHLVALLVDDFANPHKLVMIERITRILRRGGWDCLLVNMLNKDDASEALLHASQRRVDAAILIGIQFDDTILDTALGAQRVRKLIIFARQSENPDTISVCCDDARAMSDITDFVISKGYKRPLFLAGPDTVTAHVTRKETFLSKWAEAGGAQPTVHSVPSYDPSLSFDKVVEALEGQPAANRPDIIVCENDALAMGAIDAVRHRLGLRVPEDIAVTGFDDVPQAGNPNYNLTTYRQPLTAMAEGLVTVLQANSDEDLSSFEGKLIVRGSA